MNKKENPSSLKRKEQTTQHTNRFIPYNKKYACVYQDIQFLSEKSAAILFSGIKVHDNVFCRYLHRSIMKISTNQIG